MTQWTDFSAGYMSTMKILWVVTFMISLSSSSGMPVAICLKAVYVNLDPKFQSNTSQSSYIFPSCVITFYYNSVSSLYSYMRTFSLLWNQSLGLRLEQDPSFDSYANLGIKCRWKYRPKQFAKDNPECHIF